jgi:hypothetical protein
VESTLRKILPKLVRGAAIEAMDEPGASPEESRGSRSEPSSSNELIAFRLQAEGTGLAAQGAQFLSVTPKALRQVTTALDLGKTAGSPRLTYPARRW